MRYETFLFTRNQRQDFTAFIRPALLSNKDVSAIGGIFNYVSDISRLTPSFPSLYCFPLGEYVLLLRHYNSGRTHAGRAIGVIEGIAVRQAASDEFALALAEFVDQQDDLLDVVTAVDDVETLATETSVEQEWNGRPARKPVEPFVSEFLERRAEDRLFLPFSERGRKLLAAALADRRLTAPLFFAFGTNADVFEQLATHGEIEIVSFFNTERPCFRSRATNRVSGYIDAYEDEAAVDPSMALRVRTSGSPDADERRLRPEPVPADEDEATLVGSEAMSIRSIRRGEPKIAAAPVEEDDGEPTVLTMRQMRDRIRLEEAAEPQAPPRLDPIRWVLRLFSAFISPRKPE